MVRVQRGASASASCGAMAAAKVKAKVKARAGRFKLGKLAAGSAKSAARSGKSAGGSAASAGGSVVGGKTTTPGGSAIRYEVNDSWMISLHSMDKKNAAKVEEVLSQAKHKQVACCTKDALGIEVRFHSALKYKQTWRIVDKMLGQRLRGWQLKLRNGPAISVRKRPASAVRSDSADRSDSGAAMVPEAKVQEVAVVANAEEEGKGGQPMDVASLGNAEEKGQQQPLSAGGSGALADGGSGASASGLSAGQQQHLSAGGSDASASGLLVGQQQLLSAGGSGASAGGSGASAGGSVVGRHPPPAFGAFRFWLRKGPDGKEMKEAFKKEYEKVGDEPPITDGSFGVVHLMRRKCDARLVVSKVARDAKRAHEVHMEVALLDLFDHPNVIKLLDFWYVDQKHTLIFEFAGKSLRSLKNAWLFSCVQLQGLMKQLIAALAHVHAAYVVHNDVSAANVLYDADTERVCLIDFGNSVPCLPEFSPSVQKSSKSVKEVTLWYRPPELLLGFDDPHYSIDIWSVGVLFGQLIVGRPLFEGNSEFDMIVKIFKFFGKPDGPWWEALPLWKESFPAFKNPGLPPIFEDRVNIDGARFFASMCRVDRDQRASALQLLEDHFIKSAPQVPEFDPQSPLPNPKWIGRSGRVENQIHRPQWSGSIVP